MPTVFYPQIDTIRIDNKGERIIVASATINVYNVTAATSLGTISSNSSGIIPEGSFTANVGDVIRLSHATYPLTQLLTLQATREKAYTSPERDFACYILENLYTATTEGRFVNLWAQDLDNPAIPPFIVGSGYRGQTVEMSVQRPLGANWRIFPKATDENLNPVSIDFDTTTNYEDIAIPPVGGSSEYAAESLFEISQDRTTVSASQTTLYQYTLPSGKLSTNGDRLKFIYTYQTKNDTNIKNGLIVFAGTNIFDTSSFDDFAANNKSVRIHGEILRVNPTTVKCSVGFLSTEFNPWPKYTQITSLNLNTTDYDLKFDTVDDVAGGTLAKSVIGEYCPAAPVTDPIDLPNIWAVYEADSFSQSDGSNITTGWADKTGNGRTATLTGSPTFETNELNGLPIIRLGADSTDYFSPPNMSGLSAGAIAIVQKVTDTSTSGGHLFGNASGSVSHFPFAGDALIYDAFGANARKDSLTPVVTILNTWHVYQAWSASGDWGLKQNGMVVHTTATNTVSFNSSPRIGHNSSQQMKEDIWGVYIFSAKPTEATWAELYRYIAQKTGV